MSGPMVPRYWVAQNNAHKMKKGDVAPAFAVLAVNDSDAALLEEIVRAGDTLAALVRQHGTKRTDSHTWHFVGEALAAYDAARREVKP